MDVQPLWCRLAAFSFCVFQTVRQPSYFEISNFAIQNPKKRKSPTPTTTTTKSTLPTSINHTTTTITRQTPTINTTIMEPPKRSMPDKNATVNEKNKKKPKRHLCVFTNTSSTLQGATEYPVCNSADDDSVLMTKCHGCGTSHCVGCYKDMQSYGHRETKNIIYRPVGVPCIATFLDTKWDQLTKCKNNNATDQDKVEGLIKGRALSVVSDKHSSVFHLKWDHDRCPSCYSFKVPAISSLQMSELNHSIKPRTDLFHWKNVELIDPSVPGCLKLTEVHVVVLTFSPILSKEEVEQCVYRAANEILNNNHDTCSTILPHRPGPPTDQFWLLSRAGDMDDMLSLINVGCLDKHFKSVNVSRKCCHACLLLKCRSLTNSRRSLSA